MTLDEFQNRPPAQFYGRPTGYGIGGDGATGAFRPPCRRQPHTPTLPVRKGLPTDTDQDENRLTA